MKKKRTGYAFIAPAFLTLGFLVFLPTLQGMLMSFFSGPMARPFTEFVGLKNFIAVLKNPRTVDAILRTFVFAASVVVSICVLGLVFALSIEAITRMRRFVRTLLMMPWVISGVIAGLTWRWVLDAHYGVFNDILRRLGLINQPIAWLGEPKTALLFVIIASVWRSYPFVMVNILAALQTVDRVQYESAYLDGANALQKFWYVTFPNLKVVVMPVVLMQVIWQLQNYDLIAGMTGGAGPVNSTETLPVHIYITAFQNFKFNNAAAAGVILLAFTLVFSIIYIRSYFRALED